jgi:hypothetical protein
MILYLCIEQKEIDGIIDLNKVIRVTTKSRSYFKSIRLRAENRRHMINGGCVKQICSKMMLLSVIPVIFLKMQMIWMSFSLK